MSGGGIDNPADVSGIFTYLGYIFLEVMHLDGDYMRGTDDATLQTTWTDAMATALANYTAARAGYLDELAAVNIPADIDTLIVRLTALRAGYLDELDFDLQAALITIATYVDDLESRLTDARAGYLDELASANLPSDIDDLLLDTGAIAHHVDSRSRVYPQDTQNTVQLTCGVAAPDTFGAWTQIVPIDTIGFDYKVLGVVVEETSAAATYMIQLGYSTVGGTDPTTAQILGERRIKLLGTPIKTVHDVMDFFSADAPANAKLWGRVKSSTGDADTLDVSVVILRHLAVVNQRAPLVTWPWAT